MAELLFPKWFDSNSFSETKLKIFILLFIPDVLYFGFSDWVFLFNLWNFSSFCFQLVKLQGILWSFTLCCIIKRGCRSGKSDSVAVGSVTCRSGSFPAWTVSWWRPTVVTGGATAGRPSAVYSTLSNMLCVYPVFLRSSSAAVASVPTSAIWVGPRGGRMKEIA